MLGIKPQGLMPLKMFCNKRCVSIYVCECNDTYQKLIIILPVLFYSLHSLLHFLNYLWGICIIFILRGKNQHYLKILLSLAFFFLITYPKSCGKLHRKSNYILPGK